MGLINDGRWFNKMPSIRVLLVAVLVSFFSRGAYGQQVLYQQPHAPSGPSQEFSFEFANQLPSHPDPVDDGRTKAWDDFGLKNESRVTGIRWTGAFDGPFRPSGPSPDLDFLIEVYSDDDNKPDIASPVGTWLLDAGAAGIDLGNDVRATERPLESVVRNGMVYDYSVDALPTPLELAAGDYWLSITAVQTFPNPDPIEDPVNGFFDPGWGWHHGSGPNDRAFRFDAFENSLPPGLEVATDFSFQLLGDVLSANLLGDFDQSGVLDVADIDLLSQAVRDQSTDSFFDVTGDNVVDGADRDDWIVNLFGTLVGDADLNRQVAFPDFLRLSSSFSEEGNWATGDFTGDGLVGFPDFLLLSQNFGQSVEQASLSSVPEPYSPTCWIAVVLTLLFVRHPIRQADRRR